MLVADWVAQYFKSQGIKNIFVYPGGTIAPIIDACLKVGIKYECFKSEQGAGYAALAYARMTGEPQVLLVTSGPGVTNAITPLADAYYDSTPLILITGQIGTADLSVRKDVRQRGFQETPTVAMTAPIAKRSVCLMTADSVFTELPQAFELSKSGRKGPVVLDFPGNIQRSEINQAPAMPLVKADKKSENLDLKTVSEIATGLKQANKPVILLGHGALDAECFSEYLELAKKTNALVVSSFLGMGSFPTDHPQFVGYLGHTGHLAANKAVHSADFLLVLGSRLDLRQTGTVTDQFVPQGKIAWIDFDSTELNNPRTRITWKLNSSLQTFIPAFMKELQGHTAHTDSSWLESIQAIKNSKIEDQDLSRDGLTLFPRTVLEKLSDLLKSKAYTLVTGVGCHQHWAVRHLPLRPNEQKLLTSGGHGTMGYDLPSAIGAAMARPHEPVVCVVGDGSLLMNIQELAALRERNLNVKIVVLNNRRLGIVSQFQIMNWGSDPTTGDFKEVNFAAVAQAFGVQSLRLDKKTDVVTALDWLMNDSSPKLLDVSIDSAADILPMLLAGQTMDNMWTGSQS